MFLSRQIINSTSLIKRFRQIVSLLKNEPQALLITQKGGKPLVLVNACIFEGLVEFQHEARNAGYVPTVQWGDSDQI